MSDSEAPSPKVKELPRELTVVKWLVYIAIALIAVYCLRFFGYPLGGPAAWGAFGDYFGGMMSCMVGLATVLLVIRTLQVSGEEVGRQRDQFQKQIDGLQRQQLLTEHQKRLDGLISDWNTTMAKKISTKGLWDQTGLLKFLNDRVLSEAFADPRLFEAAFNLNLEDPLADTYAEDSVLSQVVRLLEEFAEYVNDYDKASETKLLTNYYRRRVGDTAFILRGFGLLSEDIKEALYLDV